MKKLKLKHVYFALFLLLWGTCLAIACNAIVFELSNPWVAVLWIFCFSFLIFNVIYMLLTTCFYLVLNPKPLQEVYVSYIPKTAIIYPIKNETVGMLERISYTFGNNNLPGTDLWILSDSDPQYLPLEDELLRKLKERFGEHKVKYRHRENPTERKQGNVLTWLSEHLYYKYFFVCDADSMAPKGALLKLIKKAEHPVNQDIALFQTCIQITHAKTLFAKVQAVGARLAQELYFKTYQALFGRQISFGHLCLIRTKDFIQIKIPKGILSHDIWDTAYLDALGKKVAFCHDVATWDEAPANYLEARARDKRWSKGTLQSWPLIFKRDTSFETRFYAFYGIYVYVSHLVLFFWILFNYFLGDIQFQHLLMFESNNTLFFSPYMRKELLIVLAATLVVIYGHKFVLWKRARLMDILSELVFSTLISLNNVYYQSMDILTLPFSGLAWKPMKKDPFSTVTFKQVLRTLWATSVLGLCALFLGFKHSPVWVLVSFPLLVSFTLSVPVAYWTAQPIRR